MSKKILVVDDDEMNLRLAEFILKDTYEVDKVKSGMECLNFLRAFKVDLILLDIEMPVMDGIKTLEVIKEKEELADIPVIFLTASSDMDTVMMAGKLGVVDYVKKPFMPDELLKRVKQVIG